MKEKKLVVSGYSFSRIMMETHNHLEYIQSILKMQIKNRDHLDMVIAIYFTIVSNLLMLPFAVVRR